MATGLAYCWLNHDWNIPFIIEPPSRDEEPADQGPAGPVDRK